MKYATIEIKERAVYLYLFEGYSCSELGKIFGYSGDAIKKWVGTYRKGELWTVKQRGCPPQRLDESDYEFIKSRMESESHTTVRGMVELLQNKCCKSTVHRVLTKMGYSLKKNISR